MCIRDSADPQEQRTLRAAAGQLEHYLHLLDTERPDGTEAFELVRGQFQTQVRARLDTAQVTGDQMNAALDVYKRQDIASARTLFVIALL